MIYLIGGPVRVGKSRIARMVLQRDGVSSITTDALTYAIGRNLPETRLAGRYIPQEEWGDNAYPFLKKFIKAIQFDYQDFLLEGAVISPRIADKLKNRYEISAVFIGNSAANIDDLLKYMGNNIWLKNASQYELNEISANIIERSHSLKKQSATGGYPFIDLAGDYSSSLETAYMTLMRLPSK